MGVPGRAVLSVLVLFAAGSTAQATPPPSIPGVGGDLVYWPVTPCRLVDTTRGAGAYGGRLVPGVSRSFSFSTDIGLQGGDPSGCNVPPGTRYVLVSISTFSPLDWGFITAWSSDDPQPARPTLDYPASPYQHAATTTVVAGCPACTYDFSLAVSGPGATHVMVDVLGYFEAAADKTLVCHTSTVVTALAGGAVRTLCAASCSSPDGLVYGWVTADPTVQVFEDRGPRDPSGRWEFVVGTRTGTSGVARCNARCCRTGWAR